MIPPAPKKESARRRALSKCEHMHRKLLEHNQAMRILFGDNLGHASHNSILSILIELKQELKIENMDKEFYPIDFKSQKQRSNKGE